MVLNTYTIKSGRFKGLVHVRGYLGNGKYYHIGRFPPEEVAQVFEQHISKELF